jgi:ribonuclease P protein component
MFKKENRLTKKKDFDAVWKNGRSSFDKILGVKILPNKLALNRFGIMVGLKVSKKAVERNKIKRRLREIIQAEALNLKNGFDVAVTVLPVARSAEFEDLRVSLAGSFKKLGLLKMQNREQRT